MLRQTFNQHRQTSQAQVYPVRGTMKRVRCYTSENSRGQFTCNNPADWPSFFAVSLISAGNQACDGGDPQSQFGVSERRSQTSLQHQDVHQFSLECVKETIYSSMISMTDQLREHPVSYFYRREVV